MICGGETIMKNASNKLYALCLPFIVLSLYSCATSKPTLKDCTISKNAKFGSADLAISIDDFNDLGFKLGDSCSVSFSNGYTLEDVPYYDGYYIKNGEPVIMAYPSSGYISITLNNIGIWESAALSETDTVSVTLLEEGKYLVTEEALSQSYSLLREEYSSDEEFANFRSLKGGNLKENLIYRGASPFDNSRKRAPYVDTLLKDNHISTIIDLADSSSDMASYLEDSSFASPYAKSLYEEGNVVLLSMGSGYTSQVYKEKVAEGCRFMLTKEAPYYVHCMEGKDRTGFVSTLLEALSGSSYEEMKIDYMLTYKNYYKITLEETPDKYNAIVSLYFDSFMECLLGNNEVETLKKASYVDAAKNYLIEGGLNEEEITNLIAKITE